jgi:hypothetical protein
VSISIFRGCDGLKDLDRRTTRIGGGRTRCGKGAVQDQNGALHHYFACYSVIYVPGRHPEEIAMLLYKIYGKKDQLHVQISNRERIYKNLQGQPCHVTCANMKRLSRICLHSLAEYKGQFCCPFFFFFLFFILTFLTVPWLKHQGLAIRVLHCTSG